MMDHIERKDMIGLLREQGGVYRLANVLTRCFEQFTGIRPTTVFVAQEETERNKMFFKIGVPEGFCVEGLREIFDFRRIGDPLNMELPEALPIRIESGCNGPTPIRM